MASYKKEVKKLRTENELKRQANEFLEEQIKKMKAEKLKCEEQEKKRYSATVYCTNCMHVNDVIVPPRVTIKESDCINCRVRGTLLLVITYPGKR